MAKGLSPIEQKKRRAQKKHVTGRLRECLIATYAINMLRHGIQLGYSQKDRRAISLSVALMLEEAQRKTAHGMAITPALIRAFSGEAQTVVDSLLRR